MASVTASTASAFMITAPSPSSSGRPGSCSRVRYHVASAPSTRPLSKRLRRVIAMASKPDEWVNKVRESIASAQEVCSGNETSEECVVAWDEVEELSAAAADKRAKALSPEYSDPLVKFCEENPETDECRVYED